MEESLKSLMAEKLGSGKKPKKAKLHMHIHKMEDGKFMMEHHMKGGSEPMPEPTQHAAVDMKELVSHIGKHFSDDGPAPQMAAAPGPTGPTEPAGQ